MSAILSQKAELLEQANQAIHLLSKRGGGARVAGEKISGGLTFSVLLLMWITQEAMGAICQPALKL